MFLIILLSIVSVSGRDLCSPQFKVGSNRVYDFILTLGPINSNRLVLITNDLQSYELPQTALNGTLTLSEQPIDLTKRWPTLTGSPWFKHNLEVGINNSITIHSGRAKGQNESHLFIFVIKPKVFNTPIGQVETVVFEVETGLVSVKEWKYDPNEGLEGIEGDACVWIASHGLYFYVLLPDRYGGKQIVRVLTNLTNSSIQRSGPMYRLCKYEVYGVFLTEGRCETPWNHSINGGIHRNGEFYLFGPNSVYKFRDQVIEQQDKPFPIETLRFDEFLICPNHSSSIFANNVLINFSSNSNVSTSNLLQKSYYAMFVAGALVTIILIVAIIQCFLFSEGEGETEQNERTLNQPPATIVTNVQDPLNESRPVGGAIVHPVDTFSRSRSRSRRSHASNQMLPNRGSLTIKGARQGTLVRTNSVGKFKANSRGTVSSVNRSIGARNGSFNNAKTMKNRERKSDDSSFQFLVTNYN
ncbi:hypothetical protein RDWZM_004821 [Blomia tropicalis]|uniref:Uncharacterized protein n=1 Tax=Blomia tropicalis TaxID=40697 RepID=A0A9Q0RLQ8_BLOTA|nr:hypothetical protein BLOT_015385 [Blomia tropicalis]KAJ6219009.1 hypothetical protein RDWZM_004821 [Blomia tropicalis]